MEYEIDIKNIKVCIETIEEKIFWKVFLLIPFFKGIENLEPEVKIINGHM